MLSHSNCQWENCLIVHEVFLATFLTHDHVEPTQQHERGAVCLSDSRHRASLKQLHRRNRRGPLTIRQWCSAVTLCSAPPGAGRRPETRASGELTVTGGHVWGVPSVSFAFEDDVPSLLSDENRIPLHLLRRRRDGVDSYLPSRTLKNIDLREIAGQ